MKKRMNMRDFVRTMKNDIDVYNNVTDDDGICYCPPIEFTSEGEKYFGWTLDNVFLNVDCALYDSWVGGGGCWGIELEKDIELPIKFIHKAIPDGWFHYSMKECYGVTSDCWKDAIKEIKD